MDLAPETEPLPAGSRVLVVACGALAREVLAVVRAGNWSGVEVQCLPPELHNRPERIPQAVRARIRAGRAAGCRVFVAYADCGTGGQLDALLAEEGVERLPGAHCYETFSGSAGFEALSRAEPGTFFLTDFLARHFHRLVIEGLGLDRHPHLRDVYFGNYRRLVYLSQRRDEALLARAREAARTLGLAFEHRHTGLGDLKPALERALAGVPR
jgi:hypothetical protein